MKRPCPGINNDATYSTLVHIPMISAKSICTLPDVSQIVISNLMVTMDIYEIPLEYTRQVRKSVAADDAEVSHKECEERG